MIRITSTNRSLSGSYRLVLPTLFTIIFSVAFIFVFSYKIVDAATFPWVQNNWTSGTTSGSYPKHPTNLNNWSSYSTSTNIFVNPTGITIASTTASTTQTTDTDFSPGSKNQTSVMGTGSSTSVQTSVSSQFGVGEWDSPKEPPFYYTNASDAHHAVYVSSTNSIYTHEMFNGNFWKYSLTNNAWTQLATSTVGSTTYTFLSGTSMVYPGGDYLYVAPSENNTWLRYSISSDTWTKMNNAPGNIRWGGDPVYSPDDGYIYVVAGGTTNNFYRYSINGDSWITLPSLPALVSGGGSALYMGSNTIYVFGGNNTNNFWKYSISGSTGSWSSINTTLPGTLSNGGTSVYSKVDNSIYVIPSSGSTNFWKYSLDNNTWYTSSTTPSISRTPYTTYVGAAMVIPNDSSDYIYVFGGTNSGAGVKNFWKYSISRGAFSILPARQNFYPGTGSAIYNSWLAGSTKNKYLFQTGGWNDDFYRYSVDTGMWEQMANTPYKLGSIGLGSYSMVYASSTDSIYLPVLNATSTANIWVYSVPNNSWTTISTPYGTNGVFTYSSYDNSLYGFYTNYNVLQRLSLDTGQWSTIAPSTQFNLSNNAAGLIYSDYDKRLYSISSNSNILWYFSLADKKWYSVTNSAPAISNKGGSMAYSPTDYSIYFFQGGSPPSSNLLKYSLVDGTWLTNVNTPPVLSNSGASIAYVLGQNYLFTQTGGVYNLYRYTTQATYHPSGDFTSSVLDLGQNSFPTTLTWNGAVPSGSTLKFQIRSATTSAALSSAQWYGPTSVSDFYTSTGQAINSIHNKNRYFQYHAFFANSDTANTAVLDDITLNYTYFSTSTVGTVTSSAYDTSSPANVVAKMQWAGNIPASTTVKFQVSTAVDNGGVPGAFSDFTGPTGTSTYFTSATGTDSMPSSMVDGVGDQWIQYKAFLSTDDTTLTPNLGTTTFTYVVNAPPEFDPGSVTANQNSDGTVSIHYSVRDPDTDTGTVSPGYVTPTFQYSLNGGSTWLPVSTSTLVSADYTNKVVQTANFNTYAATWSPTAQIPNSFSGNAKIRVVINDNEAANNIASSTSGVFTLDTTPPALGSVPVKMDATLSPAAVTLSATDASAFQMQVGQTPNLSDATYQPYSSNTSVTLNPGNTTIYVRFKDIYGNATNIVSAQLPTFGSIPLKIDASQSPALITLSVSASTSLQMQVGKTPDLSDTSYVAYSPTVNLTVNQGDVVYARFKDANGNITPIVSATLPTLGSIPVIIDASQNPALVTVSATASTSLQMQVGQLSNLSDATYINYSTTTTLTLSPGNSTVYVRFKDEKGNITSIVSAAPPTFGAVPIKVDASQSPALVTLSVTAVGPFQMQVGKTSNLSDAGYVAYNSTTTLNLTPSDNISYARFKDEKGNISAIVSATPPSSPSNYFFQDLSNVGTAEWREFFAWGVSDLSPQEFKRYNVFRSVNEAGYTLLATITNRSLNYIVDANLDPNSSYSYKISIEDVNGNISFMSVPTKFDKPDGVGGSDLAAPTIEKSSVVVSDITTTGAGISWTSNKFSNSVVYYIATSTYPGDVKTSYVGTIGVPSVVTSHSVKLAGLTPGTKYYFLVESTDSSGNIGQSSDATYTFTTLPGPAITNVRTIEVQNNQAKIAWDTNIPADSTVIYSVNPDLQDPQIVSSLTPFVTDHRVTISDLTPGVQYYYFVKSVDAQNNIATNKNVVDGIEKYFSLQTTIDTIPPVISNVSTSSIQATSATVTWLTDKPATAQLEWGTTTALGNFTATSSAYNSQHVVMLSGLNPSTTYYFRAISVDQSGNIASDNNGGAQFSFTTVTPNSLSGASATNITTTGATIEWTSIALSNSNVYYVATSTYPGVDKVLYKNSIGTPELTTSHSIILSGLTPGTQYYFLTESIDAAGTAVQNVASSSTFITNPGPVISNVLSQASTTSSFISWNTNIPTDATVVYATSSDFSNSQIVYGKDVSTTTHSVALNNLSQGTTYYYYVKSVDAENNVTVDKNIVDGAVAYYTVQTTTDTSLPVISSVAASTVGAFSATITWLTDKPATAQLEWGTTTALGNFTATSTIYTSQQVVVLSGLASTTKYYYRVISTDRLENTASDTNGGEYYTFTTITPQVNDTTLPVISGVATSSITLSSATISWSTDEPTIAQIEYGTTTALGNFVLPAGSYNSSHSVVLDGLLSNTLYYFRIISTDQSGNTASSSVDSNEVAYSFTTLAVDHVPPVITNVDTKLIGSTGAIASWTTNKPAVSQLEWGTTTELGNFTATTTIYTTQQVVVLSGLASTTKYYYRVISTDESGNTSSNDNGGAMYSFVTVPEVVTETTTVESGGTRTVDNRDLTMPFISDVKVSNITKSSAVVTFTTSKISNGVIDYGLSSSYNKETGDSSVYGLTHSIVVGGLEANTKYYFQAKASDIYGNIGFSENLTFTTNNLVDTNITTASTTDTFAQKALNEFNKLLDSFINNPSLAAVSEADLTASLSNFASKVISAPIISGTDITVEAGADTATIKWTTDKEANSMLAYSKDSEYDIQKENPYSITAGFPDDNVLVHQVKLENLLPNTTYHFQTRSQGKLGPVAVSKDRTFTTTSLLPEISNARFGDIKENKAVLNWHTDVPTKTTIEIKNSLTGKVETIQDANFVQDHNFTIDNLKVSTGYTAKIISVDADKNVSTPFIMPFSTALSKEAAKISNVKITTTLIPDQTDAAQTIVSWKTDKPSTSKVWFSNGGGELNQSTPDDSNLVTEHTVITTLLRPGLVYKIVVESDDTANNISKSNVYTVLTPKQQGSIVDVIFQNFNKTFGFLKK